MWSDYLSSYAIYISTPLYDLRFWIRYSNAWETISFWGSHNNSLEEYDGNNIP